VPRACLQTVPGGRWAWGIATSQPFQTDLCAMWGACECTTEMADAAGDHRRSSQFDSSVRVEGRAVSRGDVCETLRLGGWGVVPSCFVASIVADTTLCLSAVAHAV
jgi:hypothetical protein